MSILLFLLLGACAGWVAMRLMDVRTDPLTPLALGFLGALVGVMGMRLLLTVLHWTGTLLAAVVGAVVVVWLWRVFVEGR